MIYITGDYHGGNEAKKLSSSAFPEGKDLTRDDYVIIAGDFGLPWETSADELMQLEWLARKPWTTLFIDGNHESYKALARIPVERRWGGEVQPLLGYPNIIHLMRGQVYTIQGMRIFTMGGAATTDKWWREEGVSWFPEEMPNLVEYETARMNLDRVNWQVDYVVTHTVGTDHLRDALSAGGDPRRLQPDRLTDFLQDVEERLDYRQWYFGHFHRDCTIDDTHTLLYQRVIPIGDRLF